MFILIPAVLHVPIVCVVLLAPTDDLDGVATEEPAVGVLVDPAFVGEEVVEHLPTTHSHDKTKNMKN